MSGSVIRFVGGGRMMLLGRRVPPLRSEAATLARYWRARRRRSQDA